MARVQQGQSAKIDTSTASAAERTSAMAKLPSHEGWAHLEHNERAAVWNPIVHELEERAMKGDLTGAAADLVTLGHRTGNSAAIAAIQDYVEEHGGPSKRLSADQVSQLQKIENHDIKDPVERARIAADIYAKTGNRDARDVLRRASDELLKDGNTKINAEHARMKAAADQKDDGSTARADGQKHQQMQLFTQGPKPAAARTKLDEVADLRSKANELSAKGDHFGAGRALLDIAAIGKDLGNTTMAKATATEAINAFKKAGNGPKAGDGVLGNELFHRYRTFEEPRGGKTSRGDLDRGIAFYERMLKEPKSGQAMEMLAAQIRDFAAL